MGYDVRRFAGAVIENEFLCSICTDVLEEPVQGSCEHMFCSGCIEKWLSSNPKKCPVCRDKMTKRSLKNVARCLKNMLDRLTISCKYFDFGCIYTSLLENSKEAETHQETCQFHPETPISCATEGGCGSKFKREEMSKHNCINSLKDRLSKMKERYDNSIIYENKLEQDLKALKKENM